MCVCVCARVCKGEGKGERERIVNSNAVPIEEGGGGLERDSDEQSSEHHQCHTNVDTHCSVLTY